MSNEWNSTIKDVPELHCMSLFVWVCVTFYSSLLQWIPIIWSEFVAFSRLNWLDIFTHSFDWTIWAWWRWCGIPRSEMWSWSRFTNMLPNRFIVDGEWKNERKGYFQNFSLYCKKKTHRKHNSMNGRSYHRANIVWHWPIFFTTNPFFSSFSTHTFQWLAIVSIAVLYNIIFVVGRAIFWEINKKATFLWYILDYLCDFIYFLDTIVHCHEGEL